MKLSALEEYGLRCLLAVCQRPEGATIAEVAREEGLSIPHVAKTLAALRKLGFLISMRGQKGGYSVARPPEHTTVGEVIFALGGRLYDSGYCSRHAGLRDLCIHKNRCAIGPLWTRLQSAVDDILNQVTLQDLLDQAEEIQPARGHSAKQARVRKLANDEPSELAGRPTTPAL